MANYVPVSLKRLSTKALFLPEIFRLTNKMAADSMSLCRLFHGFCFKHIPRVFAL